MSETAEISKPRPLAWRWSLRAVGCILFIIIIAKVDFGKVMALLKGVTPAQIAVACALSLVILFLKAWRWHAFMVGLGFHDSTRASFALSFNAFLWGFLTPGRLGEFKRAAYIMQRFGVPTARAIMLCITDRIFDLAAIAIVISLSVYHSDLIRALGLVPISAGAVFVASAVMAALVGAVLLIGSVPALRSKAVVVAKPALHFFGLLHLSPMRLTSLVLLSVLSFAAYCLVIYVLATNIPVTFGFADLPLLVGGTMLVGVLPISIFNFGTREAVLGLMLTALHNSLEQVVAFSMLFVIAYIIQLLLSLGLSVVYAKWT